MPSKLMPPKLLPPGVMPSGVIRFVRTRKVERTVVALLTFAFLLLGAVAGASIFATRHAHALNAEAGRNDTVRRLAQQVMLDAVNAETGQRGFLITAAPEYLDVHNGAVGRLSEEMRALNAATRGKPAESRGVAHLRLLVDARMVELRRTIALMQARRRDEAVAEVKTGRGRGLMMQIRGIIGRIDSDERALHATNARLAEEAAREALGVTLACALLVGVVGLVSLIVIVNYIGQLRRSRAELDALNQGLERTVADRTEALVRANDEIQRFAYIVSHDLRAPLVNVMGYTAELDAVHAAMTSHLERIEARDRELVEPAVREAIEADLPEALGFIRSSTEKMDRLIKAILKLSRDGRRVLSAEPIDMGREVAAVAAGLSHQAATLGAEIAMEPLPDLVSDRLSIEQVFGNLLDNALKYLDPSRPGRIVVRGREEGAIVIYEIEDNGRGVAARDHQRIFELFRRAGAQDRPGEGLGLAFVKAAVRRLGGSVELSSEAGRGSTFTLRFPKRIDLEAGQASGQSS